MHRAYLESHSVDGQGQEGDREELDQVAGRAVSFWENCLVMLMGFSHRR